MPGAPTSRPVTFAFNGGPGAASADTPQAPAQSSDLDDLKRQMAEMQQRLETLARK